MKSCLQLASILVLAFFSMSFTQPDDGTVRDRKSVIALMDSVENIMDDDAPYADSLVKLIDPHSFKTKKLKARYALLYTAVEYKNYQPFTSDSLIMEAVNYYSQKRNIDYRFLSYYYLGCVYLELGRIKDASVALAQAEWLIDRIDNDFWKGLLYDRLASVIIVACDYENTKEYYSRAISYYERAGKEKHRLYSLFSLGRTLLIENKFHEADSIMKIVEQESAFIDYYDLQTSCLYNRLACYVFMNETDSATNLIDKHNLEIKESTGSLGYLGMMSVYYTQIKDISKSELYLKAASNSINNLTDSIHWYYYNFVLSKSKKQIEEALAYYIIYSNLQMREYLPLLSLPYLGAQYDHYRDVAEIESVKARNKITILVASIIIIILIVFSVTVYSRNKRREFENQIRDYISTINELTTQISINQDKIGNLNAKVREMLRQQFNSSDYLYTRYYEQIEDSKKAERLYRVVKNQLDGFTTPKNINHIDELLDEAFDGIMTKLTSSGLEIKEKDMLLLRFALAGFSAKSIAALLDETHQNINQRKKRVLDKIQNNAPVLMEDLRIALDSK